MIAVELEAIKALRSALAAAQKAQEGARRADYGSMVQGPIDEALKALQYALDVAEGRA